jgi:hypothetical protein
LGFGAVTFTFPETSAFIEKSMALQKLISRSCASVYSFILVIELQKK